MAHKNKREITLNTDATGLSYNASEHKIDFNKVTTLEDVVAILKAMDITVWGGIEGSQYDDIRHLLKEVKN